jgi:hypothetical protein
MTDHIPELVTGFLLAGVGLLCLIDKQFSLGLFGGRSGSHSNSLIALNLTGKRAVFFGIISLLSSAIVLIPWLYIHATNDVSATSDNTLPLASILGLIVTTFGFIISFLFKVLEKIRINVEERNHKKNTIVPSDTADNVNIEDAS